MDEKYKALYKHLQEKGYTDLGEQEWYDKYSQPENYQAFYKRLGDAEVETDLDETQFYEEYFGGSLKKKGSEAQPQMFAVYPDPSSSPSAGTETSSESPSLPSVEPTNLGIQKPEPDPRTALHIDPQQYETMHKNAGFGAIQRVLEPFRDRLGDEASEIIRSISSGETPVGQATQILSEMISQDDSILEEMGINVPTERKRPPAPHYAMVPALPRSEKEIMMDRQKAVRKLLDKSVNESMGAMITSSMPPGFKDDPESTEYLEQYMLENYGSMIDISDDGQVGSTPFLQFDGFDVARSGDAPAMVVPRFSGYLPDLLEAARIDLVSGFINFFSSGDTITARRERAEEIRKKTLQFTDGITEGSFTNGLLQTSGHLAESAPTMAVLLPLAALTGGAGWSVPATVAAIAVEGASVTTLQESARIRENPEWSIYKKDGQEYSYNEMMMQTGGDPELMLGYEEDRNVAGKAGYLASVFGSSMITDGATTLLFLKGLRGLHPYGPVARDMSQWWRYHAASAGVSIPVGAAAGSLSAMTQYIAQKKAVGDENYSWSDVRGVGLDAGLKGAALGLGLSIGGSLANISLATDPFGRRNANMTFLNYETTLIKKLTESKNRHEISMWTKELAEAQIANAHRRIADSEFYASMSPEDRHTLVSLSAEANTKYRAILRIDDKDSPISIRLAEEIAAINKKRENIESLYEAEGPIGKEVDGKGDDPTGTVYRTPTNPKDFPNIYPLSLRERGLLGMLGDDTVDYLHPARRMQRALEERTGERVPMSQDFDVMFRLVDSKAAAILEAMQTKRTQKGGLYDFLRKANEGVTKDTPGVELLPKDKDGVPQEANITNLLERYLYSLHAKEGNAHILRKNQADLAELSAKVAKQDKPSHKDLQKIERLKERIRGKKGSGLSDEDATAFLKSLDPEMRKTLERAHEDLEVIMQDTRDAMLKYGFTDEAGLRVLNTTFDNYVPLRGRDAMGVMDADGNVVGADRTVPHVPRQMDPQGHLLDTRIGRSTEATDIVASILQDNANIHIMGNKNLALQKVHEFVLQNPDPTTYKIMDAGDGVSASNKNTVAVMIDGEAQHIVFKDQEIATALRGLTPDQMAKTLMKVKQFSTWASGARKAFVHYNPAFAPVNFMRDTPLSFIHGFTQSSHQYGYITHAQDGTPISSSRFTAEMFAGFPRAFTAVATGEFGGGKFSTPSMRRDIERFKLSGSVTGWQHMNPLRDIKKALEAETNPKKRYEIGRNWMFKNSLGLVKSMNDVFENSWRFAGFQAAMKMNVHPDKAAAFAKVVTVDFNRKGRAASNIGAWKYFFNPAMQGVDQFYSSMTEKTPEYTPSGRKRTQLERYGPQAKIFGGLVGLGAFLSAWNQSVTGYGEDGVSHYDNIDDFIHKRNFVIMLPGGGPEDYVKIPSPYIYSLMPNIGQMIMETATGNRSPESAALFLATSAKDNLSPFSLYAQQENEPGGEPANLDFGMSEFSSIIAPDWGKPPLDVLLNQTAWGGKIVYDEGEQGSSAHRSTNAPPFLRNAAIDFNRWGGGTEEVSGDIGGYGSTDYNPDYLYYIAKQYLGGSATIVENVLETARDWRTMRVSEFPKPESLLDPDNFPFIRSFYSDGWEGAVGARYWEMRDRMEGYGQEWNDKIKLGEYIATPLPGRDRQKQASDEMMEKRDEAMKKEEKGSDQFRYLAYLQTSAIQNTLNSVMYGEGLGLVREILEDEIKALEANAFSSDSTLAEFGALTQELEQHNALVTSLQALFVNYASDIIPLPK